jgi:hypothetical protein
MDRFWKEAFKALVTYKKEFGNCAVPQSYKTKDGLALGTWVANQRKSQKLSPERKKQLDDLGFIWNPKKGPKNK